MPPAVSPNTSLSEARRDGSRVGRASRCLPRYFTLGDLPGLSPFSTLQPVACVHPDSPQRPPLASPLAFLCPPQCSLWPAFILTALSGRRWPLPWSFSLLLVSLLGFCSDLLSCVISMAPQLCWASLACLRPPLPSGDGPPGRAPQGHVGNKGSRGELPWALESGPPVWLTSIPSSASCPPVPGGAHQACREGLGAGRLRSGLSQEGDQGPSPIHLCPAAMFLQRWLPGRELITGCD